MMKKNQKSVVDIARLRLDHVPFVATNNRRMAVWSDVREILLWCPSPNCSVVLDTLKLILGYPTYETMMHPCSQLEQLMFLKHYMFVPHGTLLVDVDSLQHSDNLSLLYHTVKELHTKAGSQPVLNCTKMLETITEKYANTSFKIPFTVACNKILLPAVRRIWKFVTCQEGCTNEREQLQQNDSADRNKLEATESEVQEEDCVRSSKMLVPLSLLYNLYPGSEVFLDDVVRLYVLGHCDEENLQSVCQCTTEEGIQLTRFLASQNGYDSSWWCLTTCSLMISWSDFWFGIDTVCGGRLEVLSKDVCVVTLNCQVDEKIQDKKLSAKMSNNNVEKQRMSTCPSPPLSTITEITKNIQNQNINNSLYVLSLESQSSCMDKTNFCKHNQFIIPDVIAKIDCDSSHFDKKEHKVKEKINVTQDCENEEDVIETFQENVHLDNQMTDEGKNKNETQGNVTKKGQTKPERNDKKHCDSDIVTRKLKKITIMNLDEGDSNTCTKKESTSSRMKKYKTKRKKKNSRGKLKKNVHETKNFSTDIKSRLRSKKEDANITAKEGKTVNANNSAFVKTKSDSLKKSGSGSLHNSETKSFEPDDFICSGVEKRTEMNSLGTQYTKLKIKLPMTEVSAYDLASMNITEADSVYVSATTNYKDLHSENIPGEKSPEIPLVARQRMDKKHIETLQSFRNRRDILKMHSAQFQDEIPENLKYKPKCKDSERSHPSVDQTCPIQTNRCKIKNKLESEDEIKDTKSSKLEYLSVTAKELEDKNSVLQCPSLSKLQNIKTSPYKHVKAIMGETFLKNRTDALINRPRTDPVSVVLEGKPLNQNGMTSSLKHDMHGEQDQLVCLNNKEFEPMTYTLSPNKDVKHQQETYQSSCSTRSKLLTTEGKPERRHETHNDLNSSDFMKERITMWQEKLEQSFNTSSSGRFIKSAGSARRNKMCTYRPKSSIYTSQFDQDGISIKTALCALRSRERASQEMFDKQIQMESFNTETQNCTENCSCRNASNRKPVRSPKRDVTDKQTGKGKDYVKQDCQNEVQNFGPSSSSTPDLYDEFARKRKPKSSKLHTEKDKPKHVTVPFPTTLSQPIVRRQAESNTIACKKTNYHTIGYMSTVDSTKRKIGDSYCENGIGQQTYRYTNAVPEQQIPASVQLEESALVRQTDTVNSRLLCNGDQNCDKSDPSCENVGEIIDYDVKTPPQKVLSSTSVKSDLTSISKVAVQELLRDKYPLKCTNIDDTNPDSCQWLKDGRQKTDVASLKQRNNNFSSVKKLSTYKDLVVSQGIVESIDVVNMIQAMADTRSCGINSRKGSTDTISPNNFNLYRKNQAEKSSTTIDDADDTIQKYNRAIINCQRLKTKLASNDGNLSVTKQLEVGTMGHNFSKLDTQLYYKIPGDDRFHPVSRNMLIPKEAQFFLSSELPRNNKCADSEHISQCRNDNKAQSFCFEESDEEIDSNVVTKRMESKGNIPVLSNDDNEDELSFTTFDSILKASEDFIDKSRIFKHIISQTKQAIERTKTEDELEKEASAIKTPVDKCNDASVKVKKDSYQKVFKSYIRSTAEDQKIDPNKSFKEIIDEKREEKRRIQRQLSEKKYWNSAYSVKSTDQIPSTENKLEKKANCLSEKSKGTVENNNIKLKPYAKNKSTLRPDKKIYSKIMTSSQRRPKSCIGVNKGKTIKTLLINRGKTKRGPPFLNAKSHTDVITKVNPETSGTDERLKHFQNNKLSTIFPKTEASKNKMSNETDDCTSKILTALRELSIEKSPEVLEEKKGCSKHKLRTSKLRSSVAKQVSSVKLGKSSQSVATNFHKKGNAKSAIDLKESKAVPDDEITKEEAVSDISNVSKIPVVISDRYDIGPFDKEYTTSEVLKDDIKDDAYFINNTIDMSNQRECIELEQSYDEGLDLELEKQGGNYETAISENTEHGEEVFITLYGSHELGLYTFDPAFFKSSLNLSSNDPYVSEEKCLGIAYFQDANSNMNSIGGTAPHENSFIRKGSEINTNLFPESDYGISILKNDHIQTEHFCPDRNFSHMQIPTVSTVGIRCQNLNHNEVNIESNMVDMQNKTGKHDTVMYEKNTAYQNFEHTEENDNVDAYISFINEYEGNSHDNFTLNAHEYLNTVDGIPDVDIEKLVVNSLNNDGCVKGEPGRMLRSRDDLENNMSVEYYQSVNQPYASETFDNFTDVYFCKPLKSETILQQAITQGISEDNTCLGIEAKGTDIHSVEMVIASDFHNHIYQEDNGVGKTTNQAFIGETSDIDANNASLDSEEFLDETECGQEVYIGNIGDLLKQDFESGLDLFSDSVIVSKCSPDINGDKVGVCQQDKYGNLQENSNDVTQNLQNDIDSEKELIKNKKSKTTMTAKQNKKKGTKKQSVYSSLSKSGYSPSQSEIDTYFLEVLKRTGITDKNDSNDDLDIGSKSDDNSPQCSQDKIKNNKKEVDNTTLSNILPRKDNVMITDSDSDDSIDNIVYDDDDNGDDDYNPDVDLDEFHSIINYSDSDDDSTKRNYGKSNRKSKNGKKKNKSGSTVKKNCKTNLPGSLCKVSSERVRKKNQKKSDVKYILANCDLKNNSYQKRRGYNQILNDKPLNSKRPNEQVKSKVRESCLKQSQGKEMDNKIERNLVSVKDNQLEPGSSSINKNSKEINISHFDISPTLSDENVIKKKERNTDMNHNKGEGGCENNQDRKKNKGIRKKKRKAVKDVAVDDNAGDEQRTEKEENVAAEGFIKTQKRYYEILRRSNVGNSCKTEADVSMEQSKVVPAIEELSDVMEAVPVHGERVITKALSEAEKALEGTGSLADIHNDNEGVVIEDLINQCRYQMIEDEDHVQLGGMAHFKDFSLPFVYINGYKYTPMKDALTIFTRDCCVSACTIPRSVLQKQKRLMKSLSSWEQVYKLELIKMKKGPSIKTGDILVKLDTLLAYLPELTQQIVDLHKETKLKRSQNCDITAYETLKSKFKMN